MVGAGEITGDGAGDKPGRRVAGIWTAKTAKAAIPAMPGPSLLSRRPGSVRRRKRTGRPGPAKKRGANQVDFAQRRQFVVDPVTRTIKGMDQPHPDHRLRGTSHGGGFGGPAEGEQPQMALVRREEQDGGVDAVRLLDLGELRMPGGGGLRVEEAAPPGTGFDPHGAIAPPPPLGGRAALEGSLGHPVAFRDDGGGKARDIVVADAPPEFGTGRGRPGIAHPAIIRAPAAPSEIPEPFRTHV